MIRHETDLPIVKRESDAYIAPIIGATKNSVQSRVQVFLIKIGDFAGNGESDARYFVSIMSPDIYKDVELQPYDFKRAPEAQNK